MARRPLVTSKQQEILRLQGLNLSERAIARALGISRNTVRKYLRSGDGLEEAGALLPAHWADQLDWGPIRAEHAQGVSLKVLWEELHEQNRVPAQYPNFWKQFDRRFPNERPATMARVFDPGSRAEIDYCDGIDILDLSTGEIIKTHLFVGVLCYSRYAFAEFSFSQTSMDFLSSHVRMFKFFGGIPHTTAPDNLKSAVSKSHPYDPEINPAYTRLAEHYAFAPTPARAQHPKDKPIVERTIQIFQKWFFARVRKRTFTSLIELNQALAEALIVFNSKQHRIYRRSRVDMFQEEKQYLQAMPERDFVVRSHKRCTLHHDCHLQFENNYYSAPWELRGQELDVWASETQIEIFHKGQCLAVHPRKKNRGKFVTIKAHYPPEHQAYLEVTPSYLRQKAQELGPAVFELVDTLMKDKHPLRHLRRAQGIVALKKKYEASKIDQACTLALQHGRLFHSFIRKALESNCFETPEQKTPKRGQNGYLRQQELFN
jgi:transposase